MAIIETEKDLIVEEFFELRTSFNFFGIVVYFSKVRNGKVTTTEDDIDGGIMSWVHVSIGSKTISSTPEHPYFILNASSGTPLVKFEGRELNSTGNWVAAKDLVVGMKVLLSNGKCDTISSVEVEHLEQPETTYNFEVEDYHTYYVGQEGILVHNTCGGDLTDDVTSPNQMQKQVERGQAPKSVDSVHKANTNAPNSKPHVHFKDGISLNWDGTIHDKLGGVPNLSNSTRDWLINNGWKIGGF